MPDPTMYAFESRLGSIHPNEISLYQEYLLQLFTDQQAAEEAYDLPYVSITAKWDAHKVLAELLRQPEDFDIERQLPNEAVNRFGILDVHLQRQTQRPDGSWPEPDDPDYQQLTQILDPVPPTTVIGADRGGLLQKFDARSLLKDVMDDNPDNARQAIELLTHKDNRLMIAPASFPEQRYELWEPPMSLEEIRQVQLNLDRKSEIEQVFSEAAKDVKNITRLIDRTSATPARNASQREDRQAKLDRFKQRLNTKLNDPELNKLSQEYEQITGLKIRLTEDGVDYGVDHQRGAAGNQKRDITERELKHRELLDLAQKTVHFNNPLLRAPDLFIHTHDLTVKEGQTYRYRIRLKLLNPLYNLPTTPPQQAEQHEHRFMLTSNWTDWTLPIETPRLTHFFVKQATHGPEPKIDAEVWKYHKGLWITQTFDDIHPGTPLGFKQTLPVWNPSNRSFTDSIVDFYTGALLLDILQVKKIRGVNEDNPDQKVRILLGTSKIIHRYETADINSEMRGTLKREKQRLDSAAGVPTSNVARR